MGNVYRFQRPQKRYRRPRKKAGLFVMAGLMTAILGVQFFTGGEATDAASANNGNTVSACSVTDGDTIRCGGERIRLLGIDAPELPGHCREGRDCVDGDPYASASSLSSAMSSTMTITRVGEDRYGRSLAMVNGSKGDLSCWQLSHNQAIYKGRWDNGYRVARECPREIF